MNNVYRHPVPLNDGSTVTADDQYIRDSILQPSKQVVAGYENRMPPFAGVVTEADLVRLIAYIKSLAGTNRDARTRPTIPTVKSDHDNEAVIAVPAAFCQPGARP